MGYLWLPRGGETCEQGAEFVQEVDHGLIATVHGGED